MKLSLFSAILVFSLSSTYAQGIISPNSHWGAIMLPGTSPKKTFGINFFGFSRFGKETIGSQSEQRYRFTPYNDLNETLGFNFASITILNKKNNFGSTNLALLQRTSFTGGVVSDRITEFLQNDLVHAGGLNSTLLDIPRDTSDTVADGNKHFGPTKAVPIAGFSKEYFLHFDIPFSKKHESEKRIITPFFIGGGYSISTINHEIFYHIGSNIINKRLPSKIRKYLGLHRIGFGGMIRGGVLKGSYHIKDLTSGYLTTQGVLFAEIRIGSYPIKIYYGVTSASGFFVQTRTEAQRNLISEFNGKKSARDVYQAKTGKRELYSLVKIEIGSFVFNFVNDSIGGKDKGPTFGASVSYSY